MEQVDREDLEEDEDRASLNRHRLGDFEFLNLQTENNIYLEHFKSLLVFYFFSIF